MREEFRHNEFSPLGFAVMGLGTYVRHHTCFRDAFNMPSVRISLSRRIIDVPIRDTLAQPGV